MDDFESFISSKQNINNPNPAGDNPGSIPFDNDDAGGTGISHSPLDLGGSRPVEVTRTEPAKQVTQKPAPKAVSAGSADRITGVKTFFTKLHPGAINFLDEQITDWLKNNPGISIKRTNTTVGEIQAKKTEPNILVTVWY